MAKAKYKIKDTSGPVDTGPVMCQISQDSLIALHNWIVGEDMTMPHNQVMQAIALINTATLIESEQHYDV